MIMNMTLIFMIERCHAMYE